MFTNTWHANRIFSVFVTVLTQCEQVFQNQQLGSVYFPRSRRWRFPESVASCCLVHGIILGILLMNFRGFFESQLRLFLHHPSVALGSAGVSRKASMLVTHYCRRQCCLYKHVHTVRYTPRSWSS